MNDPICNGLDNIITRALEEMKQEQGKDFSLESINLADLSRRTGISRSRLRRWKRNGFKILPNQAIGRKAEHTVLSGYTAVLDNLLRSSVTNSSVCYDHLKRLGYLGSQTSVKRYIASPSILCRLRDMPLSLREAVANVLLRCLEKPTRWIGVLRM